MKKLKRGDKRMKKKILLSQVLIFLVLIQLCQPIFAMNIFVRKIDGTNITVAVEPTDTIQNVKGIVQVAEAIPFEQQRLTFANVELNNNLTLADYNIPNNATLHLIRFIIKPASWAEVVNGSSEAWTLNEGNSLDLTHVDLPADASGKRIIINGKNVSIVGMDSKTFEQLSIEISGGANVTIENLKIDNTTGGKSPISATDNNIGNTLTLVGTNWVKAQIFNAGVRVGAGTALTIEGSLSDSLTAIGQDIGAGIGGSGTGVELVGEAGGQITIDGGTIIASSDNGGAGIGGCGGSGPGGIGGASGTITINGGHVTATGGNGGAGIGGGGGNNTGGAAQMIAISTATIFATGGFGGAGIGGGGGNVLGGVGGIINILSGNITALGGGESSGIGGGGSFTTVGAGATLNIDASATVKAASTTNVTAMQPAISFIGGTIQSKIVMANYAVLQPANTTAQVYVKLSNALIDSYTPTIGYESIAFTVPNSDNYAIKSNGISQKHNVGPSTAFVINSNGLTVFNGLEEGTALNIIPETPVLEEVSVESTLPDNPLSEIYLNGNILKARFIITTKNADKTVTTLTIDDQELGKMLEAEENNATVNISMATDADLQIVALNGQTIKNMGNKEAVLEFKTESVTFALPAKEINIDEISRQFGRDATLKDIQVIIEIVKASKDTEILVENVAKKAGFNVVVPAVSINVRCIYRDKSIEITKFNNYFERTIPLPEDVDPSKITTGVIIDPDGTVRHVPTKISIIDGKYFAIINSLTNDLYSIIWNPSEFKDVENHWAKETVNDMGSRKVLSGAGDALFAPDREITRAEFAAIVVKGLGLKPGTGNNRFSDVKTSDGYVAYIETADAYGIISGYDSEHFGPTDLITREQAMAMIANAMKITGLKVELNTDEVDRILAAFGDTNQSSIWSKESMAMCIKADIVSGKSALKLAPKDNITRAEVAEIIRSLLRESDLI